MYEPYLQPRLRILNFQFALLSRVGIRDAKGESHSLGSLLVTHPACSWPYPASSASSVFGWRKHLTIFPRLLHGRLSCMTLWKAGTVENYSLLTQVPCKRDLSTNTSCTWCRQFDILLTEGPWMTHVTKGWVNFRLILTVSFRAPRVAFTIAAFHTNIHIRVVSKTKPVFTKQGPKTPEGEKSTRRPTHGPKVSTVVPSAMRLTVPAKHNPYRGPLTGTPRCCGTILPPRSRLRSARPTQSSN